VAFPVSLSGGGSCAIPVQSLLPVIGDPVDEPPSLRPLRPP